MACNVETTPTDPNLMLELTTVQTGAFKILIESLQGQLLDCNVELIPYYNADGTVNPNSGLKILALNHKEGMLIHVKLDANEFNRFYCHEKQILGINMQILHKIIKSLNNNDVLTMRRYKNNLDRTMLNLIIENIDRKQKSEYKIQLIDVDSDIMEMTSAKFEAVIIMNSNDFQKACRDLNGLDTKYIELILSENTFQMKGEGGLAIGMAEFYDTNSPTSSITIKRKNELENQPSEESEESEESEDDNDDDYNDIIIRGKYDIKNLMLFTKCTNLCSHIEIYLKNDYPLLIKYTVASLGYTNLVLSPVVSDEL